MKRVKSIIAKILLLFSISSADTLDDILKMAENADYKLKSLYAEEKAKEYRIQQSKAQYKPQITFSSYIGWQQFKPYYGGQEEQFLQYYYLSLRQPVYRPQILSKIRLSKLDKKIANLKIEQEKQYIKYYTLNLLLDFAYYKEKLDLVIQLRDLHNEKLQILKKMFEKNKVPKEIVLDAEDSYLKSYISYKEALIDYRNQKKAINLVVDENLESILFLSLNKDINLNLYNTDYYSWEKELENNFEVQLAKVNIDIANEEIKSRKYTTHPTVDLEFSYRYASTSAISVASEDKRIAFTVDFPIYQGGFAKAYILEAKQLKISAMMQLKDIKRQNEFYLKDSWFKMYKAKKNIPQLKKQLSMNLKKFTYLKKSYEKRIKTKLDLINQEISLVNIKLNLLEKLHNFSVSYVKLLYLTGQINDKLINKTVKPLFKF